MPLPEMLTSCAWWSCLPWLQRQIKMEQVLLKVVPIEISSRISERGPDPGPWLIQLTIDIVRDCAKSLYTASRRNDSGGLPKACNDTSEESFRQKTNEFPSQNRPCYPAPEGSQRDRKFLHKSVTNTGLPSPPNMAQPYQLHLQRDHTLVPLSQQRHHGSGIKSLRDMLWTIGTPRCHLKPDDLQAAYHGPEAWGQAYRCRGQHPGRHRELAFPRRCHRCGGAGVWY